MAVTKRLRYEVLRRDNYSCRYCGASAPDVKITIDHVTPVALGGRDDPSNLVAACAPCNSGKTSVPADAPIVSDVQQDALRWASAISKAAELARDKYEVRLAYRNTFREAWDDWKSGPEGAQKPIPLDLNWETSLDNFYEAGLPDWELSEAVRAAMTNQKVTPANTFRYFAGICWTKIRQIQDQAHQIVSGQQAPSRSVSNETTSEIADIWLNAYLERCAEAGIETAVSTDEVQKAIATLLQQGYSADRLSEAAQTAGRYLSIAVTDYLCETWGDFTVDAMFAWAMAWSKADPEKDGRAWRSAVPTFKAWADLKVELQGAITAGLLDEEILTACRKAGARHEALLLGLPDWEGRWEALGVA